MNIRNVTRFSMTDSKFAEAEGGKTERVERQLQFNNGRYRRDKQLRMVPGHYMGLDRVTKAVVIITSNSHVQ